MTGLTCNDCLDTRLLDDDGRHRQEENMNCPVPPSTIRRMVTTDGATWVRLRAALHPEHPLDAQALHVARLLWNADGTTVAFLAEERGAPIGFIELSLREAAEGCEPGTVAYVEAWYVAPTWQGRGVGGALLAAGEQWARSSGCRELATHTPAPLLQARLPAAHLALGFTPVSRITCWRKALHAAVR